MCGVVAVFLSTSFFDKHGPDSVYVLVMFRRTLLVPQRCGLKEKAKRGHQPGKDIKPSGSKTKGGAGHHWATKSSAFECRDFFLLILHRVILFFLYAQVNRC